MRNVEELREGLSHVWDELRAGAIKPHEAAELANIAGKMIASAKVQVEYAALRGDKPEIAFLDAAMAAMKGGIHD